MNFLRSLFLPSLRNRMLFLTVALVILVSGAVLFIVSLEVQSLTNARLQQDFTNTYQTFNRFLTLRNERLVESCILISELPVLKAQLSTKDPATIKDYIFSSEESPAKLAEVDIFILTNEKGEVMFRLDRPEEHGETLGGLPFLKKALSGSDPLKEDISIWVVDDRLYQTVCVPIYQQFLIGTLTLGKRITQYEASILKQDTQSDITFILGNRVVASTHSDIAQVDLLRAYLVNRTGIDSALNMGKSIQRELNLNGENFLCAFSRTSKNSGAVYVMAVSVDQALKAFQRIEGVILIVGILALILAIIGAFLLANGITAPLRKLVLGTEAIRAGKYDFRLDVDSKDEIGALAYSFNEMVSGLKERFLMTKFVSSSTLQMIRQEDGKIRLGGERRNVTVLFSDIRGFTSFSERVEPEVVIELLNSYLSKQASIVMRYHGGIDKFVGDQMIAVFEGEDMADNAVLCAIEMQKEINELNKSNAEDILIGIGINTGMAIVGNVGGEDRMDHTVLGNNMNLGARLCSSAQARQIIISEASYKLLKSKEVRVQSLEAISVKGISRPVQTYEVLY